jgi:hypothetical protein
LIAVRALLARAAFLCALFSLAVPPMQVLIEKREVLLVDLAFRLRMRRQ